MHIRHVELDVGLSYKVGSIKRNITSQSQALLLDDTCSWLLIPMQLMRPLIESLYLNCISCSLYVIFDALVLSWPAAVPPRCLRCTSPTGLCLYHVRRTCRRLQYGSKVVIRGKGAS
jgi:hypothetical protein